MAVTYNTALRTARMEEVVAAIGAAGKLEILTAADAILVAIPLDNPAATVSGDVLTLAGLPKSEDATGTGTASKARIRTGADADVVTDLTVGTGSEDVVLNSTSITTGQQVTLETGTVTHG